MWSLVQGKAAFHTRLRREADLLHFAPREGETYTIAQGTTLSVRNSGDGKETRQMAQLDRVLAMTPYLVRGNAGLGMGMGMGMGGMGLSWTSQVADGGCRSFPPP